MMGRIKLKRALPWRPFLGCENSPVLQAFSRRLDKMKRPLSDWKDLEGLALKGEL